MKKYPRWPVALGAGLVLTLGLLAPTATAEETAAPGAGTADADLIALPDNWQARKEAASAKLGLDPLPAEVVVQRVINPDDYECGPTNLDAYIDQLFAGMSDAEVDFLFDSGALLFPTYDALVYGSNTDARYALPSDYRQLLGQTFRDAKRFWDVDSHDIQLLAMHGDMLLDTDRVARLLVEVFGFPPADAEAYAAAVAGVIAAVPAFENGNNPIFTLNAFAFTGEGDPDPFFAAIPDKLVFGDGILDFLESQGIANVGSRAVMGHEFAHHVQFEQDLLETDLPDNEETRRGELMADSFATYFSTHARGLSLNTKRVLQAQQVFFEVGDCVFDDPGHHGTPNQRMRAAVWGADLADGARPQGKILPSLTLADLFFDELPEILAPDAN